MNYRIFPVDAKYVIEAAELKARKEKLGGSFSKNDLISLGISSQYAQLAISASKQLDLFEMGDKFVNSSDTEKKIIFRKNLQKFPPFLDFITYLINGFSPEDSAKRIKIIYDIKRNEKDIIFTFTNYGKFSGMFKNKKGSLEIDDSLKTGRPKTFSHMISDLDNDLITVVYIRKILKDAENFISKEELDDLKFSIINIDKNPSESIRRAGIVLEDFLRSLAKFKDIDVSRENGIEQIANKLRSHKLLASKHNNVLQGLEVLLINDVFKGFSAFRSIPSHGKDKIEETRWELSADLALTYVIQIILVIKSVYYFSVKNKLVF